MVNVIGHSETRARLRWQVQNNSLSHALLFVGPEGIGKQRVALLLAQEILCEANVEGESEKPCGICGSCIRVGKESHEALKIVRPEKNQIRIDEAKEIVNFLGLRTWRGKRVVVIDDAHLMNQQAANVLLKSLEEPPEGTYFFLTAPSSVHVITTIRSRCQIVRLAALTDDELKSGSQSMRVMDWMIPASFGSFSRLQQLSSKDEQDNRKLAVLVAKNLIKEPQGYMLEEIKEPLRDKPTLKNVVSHLSLFFRDAIFLKNGVSEGLANPDQLEVIGIFQDWSVERLSRAFQLCHEVDQGIAANRDGQLLFEEFWLKIRG